jgi:hypothetical protein
MLNLDLTQFECAKVIFYYVFRRRHCPWFMFIHLEGSIRAETSRSIYFEAPNPSQFHQTATISLKNGKFRLKRNNLVCTIHQIEPIRILVFAL